MSDSIAFQQAAADLMQGVVRSIETRYDHCLPFGLTELGWCQARRKLGAPLSWEKSGMKLPQQTMQTP
jgi:hypothetical protein